MASSQGDFRSEPYREVNVDRKEMLNLGTRSLISLSRESQTFSLSFEWKSTCAGRPSLSISG